MSIFTSGGCHDNLCAERVRRLAYQRCSNGIEEVAGALLARTRIVVAVNTGRYRAHTRLLLGPSRSVLCVHHETSCWPPSMSYVPPVSAVLLMMWTASAATSPGPTTRRMGSVARSSSRRLSRSPPRIDAERGVSTKPAAIRLTRIGASSSARLAISVGNATVTVEAIPRPARRRRALVLPMNIKEPGGRPCRQRHVRPRSRARGARWGRVALLLSAFRGEIRSEERRR